jgi:hypothetical protein
LQAVRLAEPSDQCYQGRTGNASWPHRCYAMSDCSATDVVTISEEVLLSHVLFGHSSLMPLVGVAEGSRHEVANAAAGCRCYLHSLDGECLRKACLHSN